MKDTSNVCRYTIVVWRIMPDKLALVISRWFTSINFAVVIELFNIICDFQWYVVLHVNVLTYVITKRLTSLAYIKMISHCIVQLHNTSVICIAIDCMKILNKSFQDKNVSPMSIRNCFIKNIHHVTFYEYFSYALSINIMLFKKWICIHTVHIIVLWIRHFKMMLNSTIN